MFNLMFLDVAVGPIIVIGGLILIAIIIAVYLIVHFSIKAVKKIKAEEEEHVS